MDVAVYLSELLRQHGEVNVPGLGYFVQIRVNGYYNEAEAKFYPPHYQVQFDPQSIDEDILAQYIADKKNVSVSSAKYFTDKYINNLKQEAAQQDFTIGELGWFYTDNGQLVFKSKDGLSDDPSFFGYAPLKIYKLGGEPVVKDEPAPAFTEPVFPPEKVTEQPKENEEQPQEDYIYEGNERKRSVSPWIILLIVIIVAGFAALGLYIFQPSLFDQFNQQKHTAVAVKPMAKPKVVDSIQHDTIKADTGNKALPAADTSKTVAASQPAATIDTAAQVHYEIIGRAFKKRWEADAAIKNYRSIGINAKVLAVPGTGKLIKLTLGTYLTSEEAIAARKALIRSRKVKKEIYIQEINPQK